VPVPITVTTNPPSKTQPALQLKSGRVTKNQAAEDIWFANKQAAGKGQSQLRSLFTI